MRVAMKNKPVLRKVIVIGLFATVLVFVLWKSQKIVLAYL